MTSRVVAEGAALAGPSLTQMLDERFDAELDMLQSAAHAQGRKRAESSTIAGHAS